MTEQLEGNTYQGDLSGLDLARWGGQMDGRKQEDKRGRTGLIEARGSSSQLLPGLV